MIVLPTRGIDMKGKIIIGLLAVAIVAVGAFVMLGGGF